MELSSIVHYVAAGFCAGLAFVTLITPTGPCLCFAHKAPFTVIFGIVCFIFFAVIQFILGGTAFSYMRQLFEQDTIYRSELTDLQIFTGCSDSETSVPMSRLENDSVAGKAPIVLWSLGLYLLLITLRVVLFFYFLVTTCKEVREIKEEEPAEGVVIKEDPEAEFMHSDSNENVKPGESKENIKPQQDNIN